MTIKVILVPVTATEAGTSALKTAFALARRFEAHVAALHARADPRNALPYMGEGMSGVVLQEILAAAERDAANRAREARALYDRFAAGVVEAESPVPGRGATASWREETGREDEIIARSARLADIVVVGEHPALQSAAIGMITEAALLESGRPVLVAPPGGAESFGRSVAIAWNGSVEASRAVAAAMPFLAQAAHVAVLAVGEGADAESAARALRSYLAWHGIAAEADAAPARAEGIGPTVLARAAARGADLLVMGAYTHNRFRQMIFGGVTRYILSQAGLPVLVAH